MTGVQTCALPISKRISGWLAGLDVDLGPNLVSSVGLGPTVVLSPDGTRLVYVARGPDGKSQLVTRMLDQEQPAPIAGTEDAISPFFSADGRSVGFFTTNKLKTISLANGGPEVLCDAPTERGASWGDDGHIYAVLNFNSGVMRIPSGGGAALPVTVLNKANREFTHRWPQVLPGSQAVLFTSPSGVGNFDDAKVEIQSLRTGRRKTLVNGGHFGRYASTGHLLYVRQGTLFAAPFDSQRQELTGPAVPVLDKVWRRVPSGAVALDLTRNGVLAYVKEKRVEDTLDWLDSTGHTQPLRTVAAPYNFAIRFSPDGKRLALASAASGSLDVWTYESERNTMTRLTFAPSVEAWPVWSPDGRHIAFFGAEGTASGIYWMRSDGTGEAERLTKSDNSQAPLSISPDGKHLAFYERNPQTGYDLWTLRLEDPASDHPKPGRIEPFLKTPYNESAPMIAPDGRWLAYQSDESGANEIYVRSFPGTGGKWQVSTGGGDSPVWSRMAPELFYRAREGMMVANYSAAADTFTAGKPRLWARKANLSQWFDLAPDGKRFAIVQEAPSDMRGSPQVTLVLNFFDELNRRTQR